MKIFVSLLLHVTDAYVAWRSMVQYGLPVEITTFESDGKLNSRLVVIRRIRIRAVAETDAPQENTAGAPVLQNRDSDWLEP